MLQILKMYPLAGISILVLCGAFTIFISSRVYLSFNSHLLSVNKRDRKLGKKLKAYIFKKVDLFDHNNEFQYYSKIRIKMLRCGFYKSYAPLVYLLMNYAVPAFLFLFLIFTNPFLAAAIIPLAFVCSVQFILFTSRKDIEKDWNKHGYKIYRYIHNQLSAGVNIHDTLKSLYVIGTDTKLETPLYEFSAWYGRTLDIDLALVKLKEYFKIPDIQMFCSTLEQGVKRGDVATLIERQEKTMFKQYFNYVQKATEKSNMLSAIIIIMLAGIICTMITIPMLNDLGSAVNKLFSN
jgi:hypothetical protein